MSSKSCARAYARVCLDFMFFLILLNLYCAFNFYDMEKAEKLIHLHFVHCFTYQVKVACCTVDIIKQLSGEEISRNAAGGSKHRMSTLANHILCQRRHV